MQETVQMKRNAVIVLVLLLVGLFMPTSINSDMSQGLLYFNLILLALSLAAYIALNKKIDLTFMAVFILINLLLWFFTLISPLHEYSYGSAFLYFSLSLMFCLNLNKVALTNNATKLFVVINAIVIAVSILIITQNPVVTKFITNYYSNFYADLVPNMMAFKKPVLTFSVHSIAGFYHYLFFYLNLKAFSATRQRIYFLLALPYLYFCFMLNSNTGYLFMSIGLVQLLHFLFAQRLSRALISGIILGLVMLFGFSTVTSIYDHAVLSVQETLGSQANGLAGRFGEQGNLQKNIEYISNNLFRPVGIGYTKNLMYVDSGFIETVLRGSILFTIVVYTGLFLFLKRNLRSRKTAYFLFFVFMLFEIGFSNLVYFRTIYLLPVIVSFLNHLESVKERRAMIPQSTGPERVVS